MEEGGRETSRVEGNIWREAVGWLEMNAGGGGTGGVLARDMSMLAALRDEQVHVSEDRGEELAAEVLIELGLGSHGAAGGSAGLLVRGLELLELSSQRRDPEAQEELEEGGVLVSLEARLVVEMRELVLLGGHQ